MWASSCSVLATMITKYKIGVIKASTSLYPYIMLLWRQLHVVLRCCVLWSLCVHVWTSYTAVAAAAAASRRAQYQCRPAAAVPCTVRRQQKSPRRSASAKQTQGNQSVYALGYDIRLGRWPTIAHGWPACEHTATSQYSLHTATHTPRFTTLLSTVWQKWRIKLPDLQRTCYYGAISRFSAHQNCNTGQNSVCFQRNLPTIW